MCFLQGDIEIALCETSRLFFLLLYHFQGSQGAGDYLHMGKGRIHPWMSPQLIAGSCVSNYGFR